ncbi:hypothetical protein CK507_01740 [Pseudomonas sp. WN033]|nr:hypothetical protein CK507_01740 [Pseudomonas sp. WN033]
MSVLLIGPAATGGQRLPLFGSRVAAGFPSPADEYREASLSLDELAGIHAPHTFLLRVQGDSMIEAGIYENDILVVDRAVQPLPGDVVIACISGEFTVKLLTWEAGLPVLMPANASYRPIRLKSTDELEVWGVVTHSLHRHRFR